MITKAEYMKSLDKEFAIIRHLASKLTEVELAYKPTDGQRSTQELLEYLSYAFVATVQVLKNGDQSIYKELSEKAKGITIAQFDTRMQEQENTVRDLIEGMSDDDLTAEVDLWGVQTRAMHLVNGPLKWATSYKIQLFLYMKASGHSELNTMNLWAGMDPVK